MLPEKRKKLIIGLISVVCIVLVVFLLGKLSSYIKSKNELPKERDNDNYNDIYNYVGVIKTSDNIYNLYGIKDNEKYLGVRTFYEVNDIKLINERVVMYSDATNELRYEKDNKEFYFYELDTKYDNNYKCSITLNYIVCSDGKTIKYWSQGNQEILINEVDNKDFYVINEYIYYIYNNQILSYNLNTLEEELVLNIEDDTQIIDINENYIYTLKDNALIAYKIKGAVKYNVSDYLEEYEFIDVTDNGFIFKSDNYLKEFSFITNKVLEKTMDIEGDILNSIYLGNKEYYFKINNNSEEKYVIINLEEKRIVKELENDYLYMVKL